MPRTFDITAASDSVRLDSSGRGETTFTVSNSSGRPQRALARAVALGSTKQEGLTIAGEVERDFSAGGVHQFTVRIAVAPGTEPGRYKLRLDIDSAKKAAEDHAEGPTVAFEVQPSEKPRKPFPWWWIPVVIVVVLLVAGVAVYLLTRSTGVPDLVNMTLDQAKSTLQEKHLIPGRVEIKDFQRGKAGTVVSQTPQAGEPIPENKTVDMVVQAEPAARYSGTWLNDNPNDNDFTRLVITNEGSTITVRFFGTTTSPDVEWATGVGAFEREPFTFRIDLGGGLTQEFSITLSAAGARLTLVVVFPTAKTFTFHRRRLGKDTFLPPNKLSPPVIHP